jgi:hypothetical protein
VASVGQNKPFFVKHRIGASFLLVPANKETAGTQQPPEDGRFVLGVASIGQNKPFFVKHRIGASFLLVPANKETADTRKMTILSSEFTAKTLLSLNLTT